MDRIAGDLATEVIETAEALADAAGKVILPYFRQHGLATENKAAGTGFDPVTVADRAAERAMRDLLAQRRPNDAILGEEYGVSAGDSGLTWVLDPIDGTRGFMSGTPTWGVLIAVRDAHGPLYGVIDQPYTQERFCGGLGRAEFAGPHGAGALRTRDTGQLDQAILFTTFPEVGTPEDRAGFERVAAQVKLVRYGMDCYAYALLAAGQIDLVIEAGLQTYDIMAPIAVIEAAGGVVTNWEGGPVHDGGRAVAAATPQVHAAALDLLHTKG
ncbi:MAG: histidinol-phosphatase [Mameliella sp.]|nr:histidinol-phosphatase [Mameliella sp.]|tara:strand:+ start:9910 stop:10719 length:810 start_codon:yes stop_codon:yes gene_type:complete